MVTSTDGVTWTERSTGQSNYLNSAVWTGSQWVAVGSGGAIVTSPDGVTWTVRASAGSYLASVTWTGQQLATVSDNTTLSTSYDGVTWTGVSAIAPGYNVACLTWMKPTTGSGQLVAVGNYGTILTPSGSPTWTRQNSGTAHLQFVIWTGTQLVAVGQSGTILTSPDGITWTSRNSGVPTDNLNSVVWTGSQLVIVGLTPGTLNSSTNPEGSGTILTSPDGITWTKRSTASTPFLFSVAWTGNKLVAVGGDTNSIVLTSP